MPKDANKTPFVTSFDHTSYAKLPEYWAASKAIDDLAHALSRPETGIPHFQWLDMIREMAAALPYSDMCQKCSRAQERPTSEPTPMPAPVAAEVKGDSLNGRYVCQTCGNQWTCYYNVRVPHII